MKETVSEKVKQVIDLIHEYQDKELGETCVFMFKDKHQITVSLFHGGWTAERRPDVHMASFDVDGLDDIINKLKQIVK